MIKVKKYYTLFLIPVLILFFTMPMTSCSPHRKGSVMKGRGAKTGHHTKPASSKRSKR